MTTAETTGAATATEGTGQETTTTASESTSTATATGTAQTGQTEAATGQAAASQTSGAAQQQEETFFDPRTIQDKPELMAAYKQMQGAYTRKTQALAKDRRKVEAYDQFASNPDSVVQYLTQQGYQVVRPGQQARATDAAGTSYDMQPSEPQTWNDVYAEAERRVLAKLDERLGPVMSNLRETTAKNIEKDLNEIDPNWRTWETDMMETLRKHPTLVKDVPRLYRMSVPEDVLHQRAVKEALAKHTQKTQAATVHGAGTTTRTAPAPRKVNSFQEAVQAAKEQLRQQGAR